MTKLKQNYNKRSVSIITNNLTKMGVKPTPNIPQTMDNVQHSTLITNQP
jgi:hypothetical protein